MRPKPGAVFQLDLEGRRPFASASIRCRHSDTRHTDDSIQIGRRSCRIGKVWM